MDAITLLKDDHQRLEKLFKRFEKAGERAFVEKRQTVDRIIEELSVHTSIEERLFYPVTRETVPAVEDVALESLEEHHVVKVLLAELMTMDPEHERFTPKVTVLIENVRHHVSEEEDEYFPEVRQELGRNALNELGDAMVEAKEDAPTRPRPYAPDEGFAGAASDEAAGIADRVVDTVSGVAQGGVAAVQDLIDRIRGVESRRRGPHGSSRTRRVAGKVRGEANEQLDRTIDAVQEAKEVGEKRTADAKKTASGTAKKATKRVTKTAQAAKTGAKRTATSASKGASRTKTTAKQAASTASGSAKTGAKRTATSASKGASRTKTTAKQAATTTARAATGSDG